jgi:hypothetical protein
MRARRGTMTRPALVVPVLVVLVLASAATAAAGCAADGPPLLASAAAVSAGTSYRFHTAVAAANCLDVAGNASADRTKLQEWECNGSGAQLFRVDALADGASRLVHPGSGKCVDVDGAGSADGTQIQLYTCNGTPAQSFRVTEAGGGNVTLVNPASGKCVDVAARATANGTKVQLWTCNGTVAQLWQPVADGTTPPPPPPPPPTRAIVAGYYPNWTDPVRIRDLDPRYNLVYLFSATPVGGAPGTSGAVEWAQMPGDSHGAATHFVEDIQFARTSQGRKIVLSVGGAGSGMSFPTRAKSQAFVDSVVGLYTRFGGFDGLDWNTFEGSQAPDTGEMIWASQQLKQRYPGFLISAPPAPWNRVDQTFCKAMADAGVLDYCAPQYYDGPGLATPSYLADNLSTWTSLLGADKVVVGFGVWSMPNYWSIGDAVSAWKQVAAAHPGLRGAFDWTAQLDQQQGYPFAHQLAPLITP